MLFLALIENAIKFHVEGGVRRVNISAHQKESVWEFAIADNGIGIAPSFHERIFKIFQRLHTDEEYPGVGMGLTLAQKIVGRHGGKIWCDSTPGQGATFLFTLPATPLTGANQK